MKTESLDKKYEEADKDSIYEDYEINLSKKEAENLVERLEKGPNDKAKEFLNESIEFYKKIKSRAIQRRKSMN